MWVWAPSYYFFSKICISNKNENKINLQSSIKQSLFLQKQKIWKDSWTSMWPVGSPITKGEEICQASLWEQLTWGCYLCRTGRGTTKDAWWIWDDVGWLLQKLQISSNPSCLHPTSPLHGRWRHMTSPCCKSHGVFTKLLIIVKKCKSLTIYSKSW